VRTFETFDSYHKWFTNFKGLGYAQIPGNRIVLIFAGTFDAKRVKVHPNFGQQLKGLLEQMAGYYQKEILKETKDYLI
jgi:hypothetical protein